MSSILDDLALQNHGRDTDPRYALGADDVVSGPPLLSSVDRMRQVFENVVSLRFPTALERERYRTTGEHIDPVTKEKRDGHRYRVQTGFLPIEGIVGVVHEPMFGGWSVPLMLDGTYSSFWHGLAKGEQPNGEWIPTEVKTWIGREKTKNGRRPADMAKHLSSAGVGRSDRDNGVMVEWLFDGAQEVFEVGVEVMNYAIVWTDVKNAPDMQVGPDGKPITTQVLRAEMQSDPAMVAAFASMAEQAQASARAQAEQAHASAAATMALAQGIAALAARPPEREVESAPAGILPKKS